MVPVEGQIFISRPLDALFDCACEQSNEPRYIPQMVRAEKITAGPARQRTPFRPAVISRASTAGMHIECSSHDGPAELDRPETSPGIDPGMTSRASARAGTSLWDNNKY